ncbi:MAG: HAMP domain-containing protein [Planctomycetota bacterium]|nr:MAG: HAMP domain-containing protein [Planctomycetota bacterium]
MRFEHLESFFRSLRFRLSAWNTAAVLLIVVATLLGVREALRYTLIAENDHVLVDDANEVALAVERFYPDRDEIFNEMERKAQAHLDRDLFVQLLDPDGKVVWTSGEPPDLSKASTTTGLVSFDGYRVATRQVEHDGLPDYTVRVGASLDMIENDVAKLSRLMMAAGAMIVFVAPLLGYFLAGRATRPLARIITTAARLRPSHLEERLPIRGTGDELDKLSLTINRFLDLLRDYLERNREFVANAAHELRSPLAALQSSVEVILASDRTVEEYQETLGEIADECGQLGVLVNQLLLLAETDIQRTVVTPRPVAFTRVVERSLDMFRGVAEERRIELVDYVADGIMASGDADRLRQVVNNLIDNALKFTPAGGRLVVALRSDDDVGQLALMVTDTGPGIGPEDLPHVFDRFYRGDKSRHREDLTAGNGLGLSICQSIVEAHGGTIAVESTLGRGTTFTVRLPLAAVDERIGEPAGSPG